jgi:hypothetical protein
MLRMDEEEATGLKAFCDERDEESEKSDISSAPSPDVSEIESSAPTSSVPTSIFLNSFLKSQEYLPTSSSSKAVRSQVTPSIDRSFSEEGTLAQRGIVDDSYQGRLKGPTCSEDTESTHRTIMTPARVYWQCVSWPLALCKIESIVDKLLALWLSRC